MGDVSIEIIADREHLGAIQGLLDGRPFRVRLFAFVVHDIQLIDTSLSRRLKTLLSSGCTVTVAFGGSLWKPGTVEPKDKVCRQAFAFLEELQDRGANIRYVQRPMLHAKLLYVEEMLRGHRKDTRCLVTSANFTRSATRGGNRELGVSLGNLAADVRLENKIRSFTNKVIDSGRSLEDVVREV